MSFARTGEAAAQNYLLTTKAVAENSWDPNKLIKESIKGRSLQKQAAAQADAAKFKSKQNSRIVEAKTQLGIDEFNTALDLKKSSRKAGIIAAAGSYMAKNFQKTPDPIKPRERDFSAMEELIGRGKEDITNAEQRLADFQEQHKDILSRGADPTSSTPGTLTPGATAPSNISAQQSAGSGAMSKQAIKDLAVSQGFSPQDAAIVVGIAGGESGYDPTNSTRRLKGGLYDTTGEDSVGLMQINWGYHKDKGWLQDLGITSREQLFDPATNMKAAKYLHSGRGGFGDWTVYNEGIYKGLM